MAQEHEKIKVELRLSQENKQQLLQSFPSTSPPIILNIVSVDIISGSVYLNL